MFDNRGTKLEIGQKIAYNISGEIAFGEIVGIEENRTKAVIKATGFGRVKAIEIPTNPIIKIKRLDNTFVGAKLSKVTNSKNLLVLTEYDALKLAAKEIYDNFSLYTQGITEREFVEQKIREWMKI